MFVQVNSSKFHLRPVCLGSNCFADFSEFKARAGWKFSIHIRWSGYESHKYFQASYWRGKFILKVEYQLKKSLIFSFWVEDTKSRQSLETNLALQMEITQKFLWTGSVISGRKVSRMSSIVPRSKLCPLIQSNSKTSSIPGRKTATTVKDQWNAFKHSLTTCWEYWNTVAIHVE